MEEKERKQGGKQEVAEVDSIPSGERCLLTVLILELLTWRLFSWLQTKRTPANSVHDHGLHVGGFPLARTMIRLVGNSLQ